MRRTRLVTTLSLLIGGLAGIASVGGLVWNGGQRSTVTSVRGEDIDLYGEGLYAYDTVFFAAGARGTDLVTIVLGIPLLALALVLYRRGSTRGSLLLAGAITYFLYVYASRAFGNAYNGMFLIYVAVFSASLFALLLVIAHVRSVSVDAFGRDRPRRGLAAFLVISAAVTTFVWLVPLVAAVVRRDAPELLDTYTAPVTEVLDLGVLVPTLVVAAFLIIRGVVFGYVLAVMLLVLLVLIAATIILATVFQVAADISFTPAEIVGPIAGFIVLAAIAVWLLAQLLRAAPAPYQQTQRP